MRAAEVTQHPYRDNGQKIRRARERVPSPRDSGRPISQEDFAPVLGTSRRHVIRLENGEQRPSGALRDRIVEVTGTEEQIESDDDKDEEELFPRDLLDRIAATVGPFGIPAHGIYANVDVGLARHFRRSAMHSLARLVEIEKALG